MHIFLTGEVQVGKSTILRRWLSEHPGLCTGGFRTVACDLGGGKESSVHIVPASVDAALTKENRIMLRSGTRPDIRICSYPEVFDTVGTELLKVPANCDLILMDEIGIAENAAVRFHQAVLACLGKKLPVMGVVQRRHGVLPDLIRAHPGVTVIEVTVQNRENVLRQLP